MIQTVVLLTDFGLSDPYVGQMKGVLRREAPEVEVIDLCHRVKPYSIIQAGFFLQTSWSHFPLKTLFLCIIDPGVGTDREIVLARRSGHWFLAPDNGLLSLILTRDGLDQAWILDQETTRDFPSRTFHGRDIFAPLAAGLSRGQSPDQIGRSVPLEDLVTETWAEPETGPQRVNCHIMHTDHFGNIILNLPIEQWTSLGDMGTIFLMNKGKEKTLHPARTYAEIPEGELSILAGSQGYMEIAANRKSAGDILKRGTGDSLTIRFSLKDGE